MNKKYEVVINDIKNRVVNRLLVPGDKLMTEQEMTNYYKVSRITVRQAIASLIHSGMLYSKQGKGTFVAQNTNAAANKKNLISLILVDSSKVLMNMIEGVEKALLGSNYFFTLHISNADPVYEKETCQKAINEGVSGIIIFTSHENNNKEFFTKLVNNNFPIVFIDKLPSVAPAHYITTDGFSSMLALTNYVISLGHTRLAYYASRESATIEQRIQGFYAAAKNNNLDILKSNVIVDENYKDCQVFLENLIRQENRPTALICGNDNEAVQCIKKLKSLGLNVPRDISVTGFDNTAEAERDYSLTTVKQDFNKIGQLAAKTILRQLETNVTDKYTVFVEGPIIKRESLIPFP